MEGFVSIKKEVMSVSVAKVTPAKIAKSIFYQIIAEVVYVKVIPDVLTLEVWKSSLPLRLEAFIVLTVR